MNNSQSNCPNCKKQKHVHEITGSTAFQNECGDCHNHRFCTVSDEAVYMDDKSDKYDKHDHYHDIRFRTDFTDKHFHEFCGRTGGAIDVGNGKHVHYIKSFTTKEDGHKHEFQAATLIDSPTDFKCS
ncbi:MAG: YmaF family protein [Coprococcus sp.]